MDILNSYLNAVRSCLPDVQRDDIINELSENLHSEIEDQQASLGRPLTDAEIEAILKQHGHPFVVAGRYREDQRSLSFGREIIGPALFPFYVRVLLFNLGITSGIQLIVFLALFLSRQVVTASSFFPALFYGAAIQFAVVTLIFSIADRHFHKHPDRWSPRTLKQPWHPAFAIKGEPKRASSRVSRFDSVAQIIALAVGLIWLRVAQGAPFLIFGPAARVPASRTRVAPVLLARGDSRPLGHRSGARQRRAPRLASCHGGLSRSDRRRMDRHPVSSDPSRPLGSPSRRWPSRRESSPYRRYPQPNHNLQRRWFYGRCHLQLCAPPASPSPPLRQRQRDASKKRQPRLACNLPRSLQLNAFHGALPQAALSSVNPLESALAQSADSKQL
jgi:hypothetical protein